MVSHLASTDPAAGLALMESFPDEVDMEMKQGWLTNAAEKYPAAALEQIPQWLDSSQSDARIQKVLTRWLSNDKVAARSWMNENEVPEVVRKALEEI